MKKKFLLRIGPASLLIAVVCLTGACSKSAKPGDTAAGSLAAASVAPVSAEASVVSPEKIEGSDNSEITSTRDRSGNFIETRTFRKNLQLSSVVITTLGDGTKVGFAYGKNGEKVPMADNHIALALNTKGDELAQMLGLAPEVNEPAAVAETASQPAAFEPPPAIRFVPETQPVTVNNDPEKLAHANREAAARAAQERQARLQKELNGFPPPSR